MPGTAASLWACRAVAFHVSFLHLSLTGMRGVRYNCRKSSLEGAHILVMEGFVQDHSVEYKSFRDH